MSTHQNDLCQDRLNRKTRKPLIQQYLQSPFSISWSNVVVLHATELTHHTETSKVQQRK